MTTSQQLKSFHEFASAQIERGSESLSLGELFELWEIASLTQNQMDANVAAIQASLDDLNAGELGTDANFVLAELRLQLNAAAKT